MWLPVDKRAEIEFVIRKVLQLRSGNNGIEALRDCPWAFSAGGKFSDQSFSIAAANPERNNTRTNCRTRLLVFSPGIERASAWRFSIRANTCGFRKEWSGSPRRV